MFQKSSSVVLTRHSRLTISAAFTNVPRFIQRGVNLRVSTYKTTYASPLGHGTLTDSRPSANVRLLIRRLADLAGPCLWNGASWRAGAGRMRATTFLNILRPLDQRLIAQRSVVGSECDHRIVLVC